MDTHGFIGRRALRTLLVLGVVIAVLAPIAVIAAGGEFIDDENSIFEGDINWMGENEVSLGCNPPTNDRYCPDDNVTRGQMAAFMHRLAVNQVVDAATAISAQNASTLDGLDSSAFLKDDVISFTQASGWVPNEATGSTVQYYNNADRLGAGDSQLSLTTPTMVGADDFELDAVEICYSAVSGGDAITSTIVYQTTTSASVSVVVNDSTTRDAADPAVECYEVEAASPAAPTTSAYRLFLTVTGSVNVLRVTSSYVPVDGGTAASVPDLPTVRDEASSP